MQEKEAFAAIAQSEFHSRRRRNSLIRHDLFAEPAWDILLLLYIAHHRDQTMEVGRLCTAVSVAPTTALRWIGQLLDRGLATHLAPDSAQGDVHILLSPCGIEEMERYLRDFLHRERLGDDLDRYFREP